jgi:hypothetical protein
VSGICRNFEAGQVDRPVEMEERLESSSMEGPVMVIGARKDWVYAWIWYRTLNFHGSGSENPESCGLNLHGSTFRKVCSATIAIEFSIPIQMDDQTF